MRKRIGSFFLILSFCAALLLGSCSQPTPEVSTISSQSVSSTASEESDAVAFEKDEYRFSALSYGYGIEGGFYQTLYRDDHSTNLTCIDYATATQAVLCDREGCTHGDENCPGWIPGSSYKPDVCRKRCLVPALARQRP